jgi:ketose-bisphosphate aldolase
MLAHVKQIINKAVKIKYAIGAFNFYNFETLLGVVKAAQKRQAPIIVQVSEGQVQYLGVENVVAMVKSIAATFGKKVPIALHLDHGYDFDVIIQCIKAGFSSVHIDGSFLNWQKNIAITKKVVQYAHQRGVWVQGELGSILGRAGLKKVAGKFAYEKTLTDPVRAREFVRLTGVDTLAVSVGALHGIYYGQEKIDFKRLQAIKALVKVPLVMHGSSGLPDRDIKKAVNLGIKIFNVATVIRRAFWQSIKKGTSRPDHDYNLRKILIPAQEAVSRQVEVVIRWLGTRS